MPTTVLCITSYVKGHDFIRELKQLGCRVLLLTLEKHQDAEWPMESVDERFLMPDLYNREHILDALSYLARTEQIDRIVSLDEFDMEMASTVREHLRIPGMGETTVRYFRDKLAMRMRAHECGILVPDFVALINRAEVAQFLDTVPPPWILKPRTSASAIGLKKLHDIDDVWRVLDELENRRSHHLLERFVPGEVMHVDSIAWQKEVLFAEASEYLTPPFEVYHGGGLFATATMERGTQVESELHAMNTALVGCLGMMRGALHTEFIRGTADGRLYFLETAARVGGAYIVDMVEAATGLNLWREWARIEVADARGEEYSLPLLRRDYGGLILSLARQEWPDMSAYTDPEIAQRLKKKQHAGIVIASSSRARVAELLTQYSARFNTDFHASMPAASTAAD